MDKASFIKLQRERMIFEPFSFFHGSVFRSKVEKACNEIYYESQVSENSILTHR